jgi:hypothetical protein
MAEGFDLNRLFLSLLTGLLILCAVLCLAQTKKKQSTSRNVSPQRRTEITAVVAADIIPKAWQRFTSAEGQFSVRFPGKPKEMTQVQKVQGGSITAHRFQLISAMAVYEANFVDFPVRVDAPEKVKGALDALRMDAVSNNKGQLLNESDMTIEGHPSRHIVLRTDKGILIRARYILSGNRIYSLLFGIPEESNLPDEIQHIRESIAIRFFDSFKMSSESQK